MKLWILSDLHDDLGLLDVPRPAYFNILVCAGDMLTGDIAGSIEMAARLADDKESIFVAGNHEWMTAADIEEALDEAHAAAQRVGVHFLECDSVTIGGVHFAGATLWTPDDPRFAPSVVVLAAAKANVIVTHFEPAFPMFSLLGATTWIYGHCHGFSDRMLGQRRLIRNAIGYQNEAIDGEPARPDFVLEVDA